MNIKYTITLHSNWHCGSGLSAGADVDALVIKDADGLPYIPGKTIKGLLRDAAEEIVHLSGKEDDSPIISQVFGMRDNRATGEAFFSDASLLDEERLWIKSKGLSSYMFNSIAATAIDENGIAEQMSLRKIEVAVPCVLNGFINDIPENALPLIEKACSFVKALGSHRNRGLGRCTIKVEE